MEETSEAFIRVMRKYIMPATIPDPDVVGMASFTVFDQVVNKFDRMMVVYFYAVMRLMYRIQLPLKE
jgi:hypothetical protein